MSRVTKSQLRLLAPYLERTDGPTHLNYRDDPPTREVNMYCPMHDDKKRSACVNIDKGVWFCNAGCGGGRIVDLISSQETWLPPGAASTNGGIRHARSPKPPETLSEAQVAGWHSALMSSEAELEFILSERRLTTDTIKRWEIGWDRSKNVYTIPIRGWDGDLWNVRRYDPHPKGDRRKIWGATGHNTPTLWPVSMLADKPPYIIIGEGEWDIIVTIQNGYPCITRTGAADVWDPAWSEHFEGMVVYLAHDADHKGQSANRKVAQHLSRVADVRTLVLPFKITEKHGKDLCDFWAEHTVEDFEAMLHEAEKAHGPANKEPESISVLDSFDAKRLGKPVELNVTIKGRKEPGYTVPHKLQLSCTKDAGAKCQFCPMRSSNGDATIRVDPDNPLILGMLDAASGTVSGMIAGDFGIPGGKCNRLSIETVDHQAVEILFARPSIDQSDGTKASSYRNVKITNVGRHDSFPNNTVKVVGALQVNPRSQVNEFLSWELERTETSVDRFDITPESIKLLERFKPRKTQSPLRKAIEIARAMSTHVTNIIGRTEMHVLFDLAYHSVLAFNFNESPMRRGWLEVLILGDTRTGKSETATRLVQHYGAGEIIGGESASYAGIIGGLQQMNGRDWIVTWGMVPINDRRLVIIDEVSGLSTNDISKMSDVRASGVARLTKIQQEATLARARAIWLSNPRDSRMSDYTYGVQALYPLIGNSEDIARFDLAMALAASDVKSEDINRPRTQGDLRYTSEACHALLMWTWTRQPENISWRQGAENAVLNAANKMGEKYVEDPPLVQAANIREKIARVAVALAARTFSTDASYESVVVQKKHVEDAVRFIDHLYGMSTFGYAERSREILSDQIDARKNRDDTHQYLLQHHGLAKFLKSNSRFRRQDIEEILNYSKEESNGVINHLWGVRMIRKEGGDIRVEPTLHELLREVKK